MARAKQVLPRIPTGWEIVTARVAEELKGFSDAFAVRDCKLRGEQKRNQRRKKSPRKRKAR